VHSKFDGVGLPPPALPVAIPMTAFESNRSRLSVAPMMAWTDRHCRYLLRLASPSAQLFTEMITTGALLHGGRLNLLEHDASEHPLALQLGGNHPEALARCARLAEERGYDEVNLNVGCPSERVQEGAIGACLMASPHLIADCVAAMRDAVDIPVTVKCRLGIDDQTSDAFLDEFVGTVARAGCERFYVHARIALLRGLSPAQNRSIPPLRHDRVVALKQRFMHLQIHLNGGLQTTDDVRAALQSCDGAMIGRAAYHDPLLLARLHQSMHDEAWDLSAHALLEGYRPYLEGQLHNGVPLKTMTRHLLGLFTGMTGARRYRRVMSDAKRLAGNDPTILDDALVGLRERSAA